MSLEEVKLSEKRVKKLFREAIDASSTLKISSSASTLLTDVTTEFLHLMALASLDRSERPTRYIDSVGVMKALVDMGFPEIAEALPDLSQFTEDMEHK